MAAAIAKDRLNLGHPTVPPASQVEQNGPNRTPASASMAAAIAKDRLNLGRTSVSRMRLIGERHGGSRQKAGSVCGGVATIMAHRNCSQGCSCRNNVL